MSLSTMANHIPINIKEDPQLICKWLGLIGFNEAVPI